MTKKVLFIIAGCLGASAIVLLFIFFKEKGPSTDAVYKQAFERYYKVFSPSIPANVDFCGEQVPLDIFYVREALDKELVINTYLQATTQLCIKRAYRFFPIVEPILKQNNIPDDFKYLMVIESGIENKVSPANAAGYWQFLKETGIRYGLRINDEVDERYHMEKSTQAACKYLLDAYKRFGNWTMAAASYNVGMAGLDNRLTKQDVQSYYEMSLPQETSRYVFRILALKLIMSKPSAYGYYFRPTDLYPPLQIKNIEVTEPIPDLIAFAKENGVTLRIVRELNPWIRKNELLQVQDKGYIIQIPKEGYLSNKRLQEQISDQHIFGDTLPVNKLF